MQNSVQTSSSTETQHQLTLIRDILIQANTLADNHGVEALALAFNQPLNRPTSRLVWGRTGSREALYEAISQARERLVIVCPWLTRQSLDDDLLFRLRTRLDQNCQIDIGWGYSHDIGSTIQISRETWHINAQGAARYRYNALPHLCQLRNHYPHLMRLKLLGTHEKFWVCDNQFAFVGNHNVLSSNVCSLNATHVSREVGIRTEEPDVIQNLTQGFDQAIDLSQANSAQPQTA